MNENKLKELLSKIYSNSFVINDVSAYFEISNESFTDIYDYIEKNFWLKYNTIHFYIIFLEAYIKTNKPLPIEISKIFEYIFENLSEIAKENVYVNSFIQNYSYEKLLFSNQILQLISTLDVSNFDPIIKVRLIKWFILNYNNWLLLKNYSSIFRTILDDIIKNDINSLLQVNINFKNLLHFFSFNLSDAIKIINKLEENWVWSYFYSKEEAWIINNLWEEILISELNKLWEIDLIRFINSNKSNLDFLAIKNLSSFNREIIYYISLLYSKKLFPDNETNNFFEYYLVLINKENISILKYINEAKSIDKMLNFFKNNEINFFENIKFAKQFFSRIFEELSYSYNISNLIKANKEYFAKNSDIMIEIISDCWFKTTHLNIIWEIILSLSEVILERNSLRSFIKIIDSWIFSKLWEKIDFNIWKISSLIVKIGNFNTLKYKEIEKIFQFITTNKNISDYQKSDFVFGMTNLSQKCRYIVWKNKKLFDWKITKYDLKKINEKTFQSRTFPFIAYHFIRYIFE